MSGPSPTSLPQDVADLLNQLDTADLRADKLGTALTDAPAIWQPHNGGSWSVAQCLEHIANANHVYLEALRAAVPKAHSGHTPFRAAGWPLRYFLKKTEPPASIKIKAPPKIRPHPQTSKADALAQFKKSNEEVRRFVLDTANLDLCGVRFKNPFVPGLGFTVATGLLVMAAHSRRHLWQAEKVLQNPDFPCRTPFQVTMPGVTAHCPRVHQRSCLEW